MQPTRLLLTILALSTIACGGPADTANNQEQQPGINKANLDPSDALIGNYYLGAGGDHLITIDATGSGITTSPAWPPGNCFYNQPIYRNLVFSRIDPGCEHIYTGERYWMCSTPSIWTPITLKFHPHGACGNTGPSWFVEFDSYGTGHWSFTKY
ncbi:hypothetical protein HUA74_39890 [Myxococcus sp. CA051A]|uniref:hypothetical protein n=1 Tax=unclassified Myxococcus TaxID=2648731 RepID=UPI00157B450C|nr:MULTISPECIES: hypothetical protein [unclassified Myxococcus]NTX52088.1 hypothetical protein [Myxococcus sp. CA039A]NTX66830.1 hypothetical protein [Myxococcus sp. CA051A]